MNYGNHRRDPEELSQLCVTAADHDGHGGLADRRLTRGGFARTAQGVVLSACVGFVPRLAGPPLNSCAMYT